MWGRGLRFLGCGAAIVAALFTFDSTALAQATPDPGDPGPETAEAFRSPIVTLDKERLFADSAMGKAMAKSFELAGEALIAENRRLEAALEEEERQLTARRQTLSSDEFRALAQEFDSRVEELRKAQDAKSRVLTRRRDEDQQRFFEAIVPVLGQLMADIGAVAILDRTAVILTFDTLDITALAVARLDATLGEGEIPLQPAPQAPEPVAPVVPETAPNTP